MQRRIAFAYALPVLAGLAGLIAPTVAQAQGAQVISANHSAVELSHRARMRAVRWAREAPVIHCGPAPLTERPETARELARPRVVPLEEAFLDAATVKRTLARATPSADR
jgi:hypothetical protein